VPVLGDGGVDEDRVWPDAFDHIGFGFVEERVGERILLPVLLAQAAIGVGDTDKLHIRMLRQLREEALDMAVLKADDRDFQLSRLLGSHESFASEKQKQS
jgi:hypothetical protein